MQLALYFIDEGPVARYTMLPWHLQHFSPVCGPAPEPNYVRLRDADIEKTSQNVIQCVIRVANN